VIDRGHHESHAALTELMMATTAPHLSGFLIVVRHRF
jgi:hypothetical protein